MWFNCVCKRLAAIDLLSCVWHITLSDFAIYTHTQVPLTGILDNSPFAIQFLTWEIIALVKGKKITNQ